MEFKEPIVVTWYDILLAFKEGEERSYDPKFDNGIRSAISRRLKYTHPHMAFTTRFGEEGGERKLYVRRLSQKEITQQQQSAVSAG